jgi:hypothetical protein
VAGTLIKSEKCELPIGSEGRGGSADRTADGVDETDDGIDAIAGRQIEIDRTGKRSAVARGLLSIATATAIVTIFPFLQVGISGKQRSQRKTDRP